MVQTNSNKSQYDWESPGETICNVMENSFPNFEFPPPRLSFISKYNDSHWRLNKIQSGMVIGFDCEWNMQISGRTGPSDKIRLIQLSTLKRVYLIKVYSENSFPFELRRILADPSIIKVGVSIKGDVTRIRKHYDYPINGIMELSYLAKNLDPVQFKKDHKNNLTVALEKLCEIYLNKTLTKDISIIKSNWNRVWLSDEQIRYAANDVYCTLEIIYELLINHSISILHPVDPGIDPTRTASGMDLIQRAIDRTNKSGRS